jgi:beta-galactosidase GanA
MRLPLLFVVCLCSMLMQGNRTDAPHAPFIPVGVWYGGGTVRAPMMPRDAAGHREDWRRDLRTIKELGFNSIKTWVDWASTEPKEGQFQFEAIDQLLTLADEEGLRVIVQFYTDSAPEWVGRQWPDASFVTDEGTKIGSQAAPGYCIDHRAVRAAMLTFIATVSARARQHASLYGFDVWSEPHIVNWVWFNSSPEFCYCAYTQAKFRDWLRQKYGSLDAVNAAWYRTFTTWDEVEAPRYGTILSYTDFMDWKAFVADKLRDDLAAKADATGARGVLPISSHSDAPAVLLSPLSGYGNPDDWLMSRVVDFYGTSIYPRHASSAAPWSPVRLMASLDGIRSAAHGKGWWIGELQAGQGATGVRVGTPVTPEDVRLWGWAALSRGARSISYYAYYPMSSGYESNGYGLIDLHGGVTDRARAAGAFAGTVSSNVEVLDGASPLPAKVAIVYDRLAYMAGGNTVGPGTTVRNSMLGVYRALYERNIPVDFLHIDDVASMAAQYKAIYFGTPLMLPGDAASALRAYVHDGGTLISEARPAWNDARGFANVTIPGAGLDEVFGVREQQLKSGESIVMTGDASLHDALAPLAREPIPGTVFAESLAPANPAVRVLARFDDGSAAITAADYGRGHAVLIGSFAGAAFEQDPVKNRNAGVLIQTLVSAAGVEPDIQLDAGDGVAEARILQSSHGTLLIAINHDEQPRRVSMVLRSGLPAAWRQLDGGQFTVDGRRVIWSAPKRGVLVLASR